MNAGGDTSQDSGPQQNGLFRCWRSQFNTGGVRKDLAHEGAATSAAADDDPLHRGTSLGLCVDDLAQAVADPAETRDVEADEAVEIAVHAKARNDGAGVGGGKRGAVAEEFRHNVDAARKARGIT